MITLKMVAEKFTLGPVSDAVRELSQFSHHELCDIGNRRCDIENIVRRTVRAERTRKAPVFSMRRANSAAPSTMTMSAEAASAAAPCGSAILPRSK